MAKKFTLLPVLLVCACLYSHSSAETLDAFPGAEGAGRYTLGGRGGDVFEVTHLGDSGPGSLREAIDAKGPRTVVFRVSGTIALKSDLKIKNPFITIAGQTAPGDGICLRDYTLFIGHNDVIIRYLRFRLGDVSGAEKDAIWGRYCENVIVDHCSASWSVDEALSLYGIDSLTVQWCIVSESLYNSTHEKGAHGYGGLWGGRNATFHHNLIAHHSSRTPRFTGSSSTPPCENVDFSNNVIYNWGFNSAYGGENGTINMVANYYKAGPATKSGKEFRIVEPYDKNGRWYIEDNFVVGSPSITANNWAGGVQGGDAVEAIIRVETPFPNAPQRVETAEDAYLSVLAEAGASFPVRDAVDTRIVGEVEDGTATFEGPSYEVFQGFPDKTPVRGIIDSQAEVGGWPELQSTEPPTDSDHDGMPDDWERENGLEPELDTDRNQIHASGYTMLEMYLNSLIPDGSSGVQEPSEIPDEYVLLQNFPNPFNPGTTIAFNVSAAGIVDLQIFDIRGRLIQILHQGPLHPGNFEFNWSGQDLSGNAVSSGIYLAVLRQTQNQKTEVLKMQLIR